VQLDEARRARCYPISRWWLRPAAGRLAALLVPTRVRPIHLTLCGLLFGCAAAVTILWWPEWSPLAAMLVLAAWFFDRADGQLARRQATVSRWGAWLDANVDEVLDVALHVAVAAAASARLGSPAPWLLLAAFLAGKHLFMYGLATEEHVAGDGHKSPNHAGEAPQPASRLRNAYHLPGNADVRVHVLAAALLTGWFLAELAFVAAYYNLRWIARYVLVARRLGLRP
jgi:phosphatidylglycerophosphate synthase